MKNKSSYVETARRGLRNRVKRLNDLIEMNAPDNILCREVALVMEIGLRLFGPKVFSEFGVLMSERSKAAYGYCTMCAGDPKPATEGRLCASCMAECHAVAAEFENDLNRSRKV